MEAVGLTASEFKTVKKLITERFDFVYGDAHGIAFVLDPRYMGVGVDTQARAAVDEYVVAWHGIGKVESVLLGLSKYARYVREYRVGAPKQWEMLCDRKIAVYDFWCNLNQFPLLQEIALQLSHCASSSAASERNFSTNAYIHSKLRNRLASSRVENLVHIFFNAKNIGDDDLSRYTEIEDALRDMNEEEESEDDDHRNPDEAFKRYSFPSVLILTINAARTTEK